MWFSRGKLVGSCEHNNDPFDSTKCRELFAEAFLAFHDSPSCKLLKKCVRYIYTRFYQYVGGFWTKYIQEFSNSNFDFCCSVGMKWQSN
jgi:hypothetical protein